MAVTGVYNSFKRESAAVTFGGFSTEAFVAMLYSTGYIAVSTGRISQEFVLNTPNSSQSVQAFEPSTAGGAYERESLLNVSITQVDAREAVEIDADDVTFGSVSSSAGVIGGCAIFYEQGPSDSSGRRCATFYDFDSPVTPNGGDIVVQFSTGGWLELLASTSDAS